MTFKRKDLYIIFIYAIEITMQTLGQRCVIALKNHDHDYDSFQKIKHDYDYDYD